ncbi:MAG: uracil-DNA glycosylase [Candidatus Zixiibacteriota bacterium]
MNNKEIEGAILRFLLDQGENDLFFRHVPKRDRGNVQSSSKNIRSSRKDTSGMTDSKSKASKVDFGNRSHRSREIPKELKKLSIELPDIEITDKKKMLEEYEAKIKDCMNCRLGKSRTNFVFGEGNPDADVMFIGEAPGKNEDETGKPFVGRGGQLLTKIIEAMEMKREEVFIGNIIKCRPPNNRDPKNDEAAECIDYLLYQIAVIQPKILIFLGRIAAHTLLNTKKPMRELRKTMHKFAGIPAVVTYHPAALLRNQAYKRPAWEDMKRVMAFLSDSE